MKIQNWSKMAMERQARERNDEQAEDHKQVQPQENNNYHKIFALLGRYAA